MTDQRFEDLPVWQKAAELYELTEELLESPAFKATTGFRDQLDRAALSVFNNIAEGFERGTTNELPSFLSIARGSAGEVRSMLTIKLRRAEKSRWPADLKSQLSNLKSLAESCSRQLRAWADSLQNSDIKGQHHLTAKSRQQDERKSALPSFRNSCCATFRPVIHCAKTPRSAASSERRNLRRRVFPRCDSKPLVNLKSAI